jgi:hypothetical protein
MLCRVHKHSTILYKGSEHLQTLMQVCCSLIHTKVAATAAAAETPLEEGRLLCSNMQGPH